MIKKLAIFGLVMMLTVAFASVAAAAPPPSNAANNATQCANAGGVFVLGTNGQPNTCTVTTELAPINFDGVIVKAAGNSGKGWNIDGSQEQSQVQVVTKGAGPGVVEDPTIIAGDVIVDNCYNPGGNEMDLNHKNCQ